MSAARALTYDGVKTHMPIRPLPTEVPTALAADLQQVCADEFGCALTLPEAEQLGRRMLTMFALLFTVHERTDIHRSGGKAPLTTSRTNGTV
jgi:hypothetical protein